MRLAFGKVNNETNTNLHYKGKKGLEKAIDEALSFEKKHDRKPRQVDLNSIYVSITNGYWEEFGILK